MKKNIVYVLLILGIVVALVTPMVNAHGTAPTGAKVFRPAQTISNATWTPFLFSGENWDPDGFHSTVTNTDRLTVPAGGSGRYIIGCNTLYNYGGTGDRGLAIDKNGAFLVFQTHPHTNNTGYGNQIELSTVDDADAGDYYRCLTFQNNGGNLDTATPINFYIERTN